MAGDGIAGIVNIGKDEVGGKIENLSISANLAGFKKSNLAKSKRSDLAKGKKSSCRKTNFSGTDFLIPKAKKTFTHL